MAGRSRKRRAGDKKIASAGGNGLSISLPADINGTADKRVTQKLPMLSDASTLFF
jgi:hypothetical protein